MRTILWPSRPISWARHLCSVEPVAAPTFGAGGARHLRARDIGPLSVAHGPGRRRLGEWYVLSLRTASDIAFVALSAAALSLVFIVAALLYSGILEV